MIAQTKQAKSKKPSKSTLLITLCVLGGVAMVLSLMILFPKSSQPTIHQNSSKKRGSIAEVAPSISRPIEVNVDANKEALAQQDKKRRAELARLTPEEHREMREQQAIEKAIDLEPVSNRVFKTGTEQQIALIFTTPLGNPPPFLAQITLHEEAHLIDILMNRVDPNETDSEKIREAKEVVELAKEELRSYIKEGGDIESFLEYYHGKLQQAFHERSAAQTSVMQVIRDEPEIAADYIREVNKRLDAKGIRRVTIAPIVADRIGYTED